MPPVLLYYTTCTQGSMCLLCWYIPQQAGGALCAFSIDISHNMHAGFYVRYVLLYHTTCRQDSMCLLCWYITKQAVRVLCAFCVDILHNRQAGLYVPSVLIYHTSSRQGSMCLLLYHTINMPSMPLCHAARVTETETNLFNTTKSFIGTLYPPHMVSVCIIWHYPDISW